MFHTQINDPPGVDVCVLPVRDQCDFSAMDISLTLCHLLKTQCPIALMCPFAVEYPFSDVSV